MNQIYLPPKTTKPIHPAYGNQLGYRCPVCIGNKGYRVKSAFSGGSACMFCEGGRITNKKDYQKCFTITIKE